MAQLLSSIRITWSGESAGSTLRRLWQQVQLPESLAEPRQRLALGRTQRRARASATGLAHHVHRGLGGGIEREAAAGEQVRQSASGLLDPRRGLRVALADRIPERLAA